MDGSSGRPEVSREASGIIVITAPVRVMKQSTLQVLFHTLSLVLDADAVLVDLRRMTVGDARGEELARFLADALSAHHPGRRCADDQKVALVCAKDVDFGVMRQASTLAQLRLRGDLAIEVFRNLDAARAWLLGHTG